MISRFASVSLLLSITGVTAAAAQAPGHTYVDDFGVEQPLLAPSNSLIATYYGWDAATVFGHEILAMTADQYAADLASHCFSFYLMNRSGCFDAGNSDFGALLGLPLFGDVLPNVPPAPGGKPLGLGCPVPSQACFGPPISTTAFDWTAGTEVVFALAVYQGIDPVLNTANYNWFFSGDPTRNAVSDNNAGFAHLALWPDGVAGDKGNPPNVPGTDGVSLYGWEDVGYVNSDWDFDDAIFTFGANPEGTPTSVTPEPATLGLLGSGLAGLGVLAGGRRRRRKVTVT